MLPLWRWFTPPTSSPARIERRRRLWSLRASRHALGLLATFIAAVCLAWVLVVAVFYGVLYFAGVQT